MKIEFVSPVEVSGGARLCAVGEYEVSFGRQTVIVHLKIFEGSSYGYDMEQACQKERNDYFNKSKESQSKFFSGTGKKIVEEMFGKVKGIDEIRKWVGEQVPPSYYPTYSKDA